MMSKDVKKEERSRLLIIIIPPRKHSYHSDENSLKLNVQF